MSQIPQSDVAAKIASFFKSAGIEFHQEAKDGESMLRIQAGKTLASSPKSVLQSVGGFVLVNLPGNTDQAVGAAADFLSGGNSPSPSVPLSN